MTTLTVSASQVRVPEDARAALDDRQPVAVMAHNRPRYVIIHHDDFTLVSTILEKNRTGRPIPIERLLTDDDFELIVEERDEDLATGILESWSA